VASRDKPVLTRIEEHLGRATALHLQRIALKIVKGPDKGKRAELQSDRLRIGRGVPNDLPLSDDLASRMHAELSVTAEGIRLLDLGSRNGTYLGPHRVVDAFVQLGDKVRIGEATIAVESAAGSVALPLAVDTAFGRLLGQSVPMRRVIDVLSRAAPTEATVLITGETGTGKEEAARALHAGSARAGGPFVVLDCGSIPGTLLAAELFGHERGAFTGAVEMRRGAFERAHGGTLLLDELGELALDLQPQLLRVLERREVQRLGGGVVVPVDVRVVASTNRDLRRDVNAGRFRADLFFRLAVVEVGLPPLRDRLEDLPLLAAAIFGEITGRTGARTPPPTADEIAALATHYWPGNVRELRNVVERSVLLGSGLDVPDVAAPLSGGPHHGALASRPYRDAKADVVDRFERAYVEDLLARAEGNVSKAARQAQMDRSHLIELLKKHGLSR
jgi:DNA-binding NtrC family response regulator